MSDNANSTDLSYRPLLTVSQVAEWLNVGERSVWDLVADGKLVPFRVKGRAVRFSPAQVEEHIRRSAGR